LPAMRGLASSTRTISSQRCVPRVCSAAAAEHTAGTHALRSHTAASHAHKLHPRTLPPRPPQAARQKATVANLHRLGVRNALAVCHDGRALPGLLGGFDRALLDAPCSGLGVISHDPSVKVQRTLRDIQRTAHLQKELLCAAVDCVSAASLTGGVVVYSTCSVSVEENEQVGGGGAVCACLC
jgi:16S rRNA methyltransferase RsmB/F